MMFSATRITALLSLAGPILASVGAFAQGPPHDGPAKVVVANAHEGVLAPQAEFRGTVYFKDVSDVATEVSGKVTAVLVEEGQIVRKGQILVKLDDLLIKKDMAAVQARLEHDRVELEDAEVRYQRAESLVGRGLATPEDFDTYRFDVKSLRFQVAVTQAETERIEALIEKSAIYAPFDGIVLERDSDLGEWKSSGDTVAVIARQHDYEIVVDVPETAVSWIRPGQDIELRVGERRLAGTIDALIPRGDIATRTFPVRVRVQSDAMLLEGMAAMTRLPVGEIVRCILVPRDAVLQQTSEEVVFTVQDGVAKRHAVRVIGYERMLAGISAPDLSAGHRFIVKGHERLRDGAPVQVVEVPAAPLKLRDSDD